MLPWPLILTWIVSKPEWMSLFLEVGQRLGLTMKSKFFVKEGFKIQLKDEILLLVENNINLHFKS